ncbi:pyridoxamine 5'-phosphate oxidase family protein [Nocardioidaceae bacterium SCSIO 66511]|nr:pyridoxamine 5'-phosphate oxidase family protein [Nocardioidaceae bacterium SCSIO 66511]
MIDLAVRNQHRRCDEEGHRMSDQHEKAVDHLTALMSRARLCMLTTTTADGRQASRPMALQEVEFDGDLWFFADDTSAKVRQIAEHPQVNVAFSDNKDGEWTSISGPALLVHDREKAEALWSSPLKARFPDGIETPGLSLIKVHAESAEYWEGPNSKVVRLLGAARAAAAGDPTRFPGPQRGNPPMSDQQHEVDSKASLAANSTWARAAEGGPPKRGPASPQKPTHRPAHWKTP